MQTALQNRSLKKMGSLGEKNCFLKVGLLPEFESWAHHVSSSHHIARLERKLGQNTSELGRFQTRKNRQRKRFGARAMVFTSGFKTCSDISNPTLT